MINPAKVVQELIDRSAGDTLFRAVLIAVADGQAMIRRDGSDVVEGPYPIIDGVRILVGDEALIARVGTGYVVVGRIRRAGIPAIVPPLIYPSLDYIEGASSGVTNMTNAVTYYDASGCSVSLSAGRWVVHASVTVSDASAGTTIFLPAIRNSPGGTILRVGDSLTIAQNNVIQGTIAAIINITDTTTVVISALSTKAGSSLQTGRLMAFRIG